MFFIANVNKNIAITWQYGVIEDILPTKNDLNIKNMVNDTSCYIVKYTSNLLGIQFESLYIIPSIIKFMC